MRGLNGCRWLRKLTFMAEDASGGASRLVVALGRVPQGPLRLDRCRRMFQRRAPRALGPSRPRRSGGSRDVGRRCCPWCGCDRAFGCAGRAGSARANRHDAKRRTVPHALPTTGRHHRRRLSGAVATLCMGRNRGDSPSPRQGTSKSAMLASGLAVSCPQLLASVRRCCLWFVPCRDLSLTLHGHFGPPLMAVFACSSRLRCFLRQPLVVQGVDGL